MTGRFTPSDHDVREEIRTQLTANICVEAGAGTGKTTVLVDRIVEVLRRGHAAVDQLVVITFTEKAAAELASRVRRGLEDALRLSGDHAESTRLASAIRGLNHAHIETIHAFAAGLLRERPVEAMMDPGFEVLDDLPAQLAFRAAWDEWITTEMAQEPPPDALLTILDLRLDFRHVRDAADRLNRHRYALPLRPYPPEAAADVSTVLATVRDALGRLREIDARVGMFEDAARQNVPEYIDIVEQLLDLDEGSPALTRALASVSFPSPQPGSKTRWPRGSDCDAAKASMRAIKDAVHDYVMSLRRAATGGLVLWLEGFVRFYAERRRLGGFTDFDDLLIRARDLVRDRPEVRRYFQDKYRCILVDEFQDTDPLQAEMIVRLCAEDGGESDWRGVALRPGALFAVGDPKQSIYRFRRADITMYDEVKRGVFRGEKAIVQNFRSAEPIITWVNDVFGSMIAPRSGVQPAYIPLKHHPAFADGAVRLVRGTVPSGARMPDIRAAEASALAALIAHEVNGDSWLIRSESGGSRPATWRDVAVLIPSRTELQIYEDAFARASIPYRHEGGRTFFLRQEVRELVAILRAIDDPSDGVAAVAALRSSAFGCSDEDLFLHRAAGGRFDHAASKRTDVAAVTHGLDTLSEFAELRHTRTLPDLVRAVLDRTRLVEFAMLQPQGDQVAANLLKVIDQARAFAAAEGSGLRGFTRWLKDNVTRAAHPRAGTGGDETDALISEDTDNVVRIVTIHASKGLEFPIVVFANMCGERADMTNVIAVRDREEGASLHMKLGKKDDGFRTPGYDAAELIENDHREAEEKRLLYVAATRAKDRLVVPFFDKAVGTGRRSEPNKSLNEWLRQARADEGEAIAAETLPAPEAELPIWRGRIGAANPDDIARVTADRGAWMRAHDNLVDAGNEPLRVRTATSMKSEPEPPWASDEQVRRGRAADFGTAVHALLERIDLRDYADLSERAHTIAAEFGMHEREDEIERVARNALTSPILDRARASIRVLREIAFTAPLPTGGGFAEGRIDLMFVEKDGIVVVDFKTDNIKQGDLAERTNSYRPQALVYAWAAARATNLPVREVVFLYARLPAESPITVDAAFMTEADSLMRDPLPA